MIGRGRMYSDQILALNGRRHRGSSPSDTSQLPAIDPLNHSSDVYEATASHRMHAEARFLSSTGPQGSSRQSRSRRSPTRRRAACRSRSPSANRLTLPSPPSPLQDSMRVVESSVSPANRLSFYPGSSSRCPPPFPPSDVYERQRERQRERPRDWGLRRERREGSMLDGSPFVSRNRNNNNIRGGGVGFRGRGRLPNPSWKRFGGNDKRRSFSRSPSVDSVEEHRRSRSREKARRRRQYETIQRYCRPGGEQQVCWDGFQWVRKGDNRGDIMFDQTMNATRKARRLHIGNLPLLLDATEEDLSLFLWDCMRRASPKYNGKDNNPVLHVWFSKERGGNYGFVEMASVEDAEVCLSLNPLVWKGQQLRVNRPTEWKTAETNFAEIAGAVNVPLLESVASATAIAETTGDSAPLAKLLESLSEEKRKVLADFLLKCPTGLAKGGTLPVELLQCQIQAELLHGQPSRVVRIANPVPEALTDAEMEETLLDVLEEVNKRKDVLAALVITQDLEKLLPAAEVGDIYVQFATSIQADICILSFAGRMYDGRPLAIERFNEMVWRQSMQKFAKSLLQDILAQFI